MTAAAPTVASVAAPASAAERRTRGIGAAGLLALVLLIAWQPPWIERLQSAGFDAYQLLRPRPVQQLPVTIVEVDALSLQALGQWPWPRHELARLVQAIHAAGPAAIGLNILMPEADGLSPERLLARHPAAPPAALAALAALPANDALLAQALAASPSVLVLAGTPEPRATPLHAVPVLLSGDIESADQLQGLTRHAGALTSIDLLDSQAAGWGLASIAKTRGIVRRIPLVAAVQGTLVPSLAVEMLRVASRRPTLRLQASGPAVTRLDIGALQLPTDADGAVWPYFSARRADRYVSAVDVLQGRVDAARLRGQLVLIGVTALGLGDYADTPIGQAMPGSEIQAQLIENLLEGSQLSRPAWAPRAEAGLLLLLGGVLVGLMPRLRPAPAAGLVVGLVLMPAALGWAVFRSHGLLLDAATPGLALLLLFGLLLELTLGEANRQRRALQQQVQAQREQSARMAGEMAAAQRIQTGSLPRLDLLQGDARADLHAVLTPAREVGGDLYDFFRLDERRLFLLIGDVSGKGLSASIFMAVSKALCKNAMLRSPTADIGQILTAANAEVSRDNAEMLFVTVFAAILDLDSGRLDYCNAGHDNPYRLQAGPPRPLRIADGDGPPLCVVSDFDYVGGHCQLERGEWLCLITDGVTEARNAAGELFGATRTEGCLLALSRQAPTALQLVRGLQAEVVAFSSTEEPYDDMTILALRWQGPAAAEPLPQAL